MTQPTPRRMSAAELGEMSLRASARDHHGAPEEVEGSTPTEPYDATAILNAVADYAGAVSLYEQTGGQAAVKRVATTVAALRTALDALWQRGVAEGESRIPDLRARDADGLLWWLHDCGSVLPAAERPGPHACGACSNAPGPWGALYVARQARRG